MLRRYAAVPFALFALTLFAVACGDDDTEATPGVTSPVGSADDAPAPGSDARDSADPCAVAAEAAAPGQAFDVFVDNPDVTWAVAGVTVDGSRTTAEIVPTPDEVGYPRFRFVSDCGDEVVLLAGYALDDGSWILLFTTDEASGIEFDPALG
jgi:hypothetical protein